MGEEKELGGFQFSWKAKKKVIGVSATSTKGENTKMYVAIPPTDNGTPLKTFCYSLLNAPAVELRIRNPCFALIVAVIESLPVEWIAVIDSAQKLT